MTSKTSESPGARTTHLIQYSAFTPDDGETSGVATVTAITTDEGQRVPYAELARIPGFREGTVLRTGDDERPRLLGPGADTPGHPHWCTDHQDDLGDGTALCWGTIARIGDASVQVTQPGGEPVTVWLHFDSEDQGDYLRPDEARERAQELRQVADQLDAFAAQAEAGIGGAA